MGFTPPTNYTFTAATPGTWEHRMQLISDANPLTGLTTTVTLSTAKTREILEYAGIIFSQPTTNSIGDKSWFNTDVIGTQDANEASVSGVTVTLYDNSGNAIATTVTDANGNYLFINLPKKR